MICREYENRMLPHILLKHISGGKVPSLLAIPSFPPLVLSTIATYSNTSGGT
jgi:hypothetical protein